MTFRAAIRSPLLHAAMLVAIVAIAWFVAGHWNTWTGALRYQQTSDAYVAGDVTPLSAKVPGYVRRVLVGDYQSARAGDLIVEIEPADYQAQLDLALGNHAAAAALAQIGDRRIIQQTLIDQAEATIEATQAELNRANLEAKRQTALLKTRLEGTSQRVEQAEAEVEK